MRFTSGSTVGQGFMFRAQDVCLFWGLQVWGLAYIGVPGISYAEFRV